MNWTVAFVICFVIMNLAGLGCLILTIALIRSNKRVDRGVKAWWHLSKRNGELWLRNIELQTECQRLNEVIETLKDPPCRQKKRPKYTTESDFPVGYTH